MVIRCVETWVTSSSKMEALWLQRDDGLLEGYVAFRETQNRTVC